MPHNSSNARKAVQRVDEMILDLHRPMYSGTKRKSLAQTGVGWL